MARRITVLAGVLAGLLVSSFVLLRAVFETIFFAITVAYVLYPVRERLLGRGLGPRLAAAVSTALAFVAAALLMLPLVVVIYLRLGDLQALAAELPTTFTVEVFGVVETFQLASLSERALSSLGSVGIQVAQAAPAIAFKLFLFVLLTYTLLIDPEKVKRALLRPVPREFHDVVWAMHRRIRSALYAIYVLQAATAVGTFVIALVFFWALGYGPYFSLAVISGVLQFIPILGPSVVILAIGGFQVAAGNTTAAVLVVGLGLFLIGFAPDAVIRPQLASLTAGMPGSLYFIGFTGGVLSIGVVGVIAGPVLVAMIAEAGALLASERHSEPVAD